jgi:hypothetical protein
MRTRARAPALAHVLAPALAHCAHLRSNSHARARARAHTKINARVRARTCTHAHTHARKHSLTQAYSLAHGASPVGLSLQASTCTRMHHDALARRRLPVSMRAFAHPRARSPMHICICRASRYRVVQQPLKTCHLQYYLRQNVRVGSESNKTSACERTRMCDTSPLL